MVVFVNHECGGAFDRIDWRAHGLDPEYVGQMSPPTTDRRIHSLDGLRGIAALIVVMYHCLLITPSLWDQIAGKPVRNSAQWILAYTPFRIIWAGGEAVWIFFILSGFVLVRPYLGDRQVVVGRYYVRRALRLYVPFVGSFVLAVALRAVQPDRWQNVNGWLFIHQIPTATSDAIRTLFLFTGDHTTYNDVWWSLRWEVWFSALLPLMVIVARRWRAHASWFALVCVVLIGASNAGVTTIHLFGFGHDNPMLYLPMFGIGMALAMAEDRVRSRLEPLKPGTVALGVFVSSAAMTSTVAVLRAVQSTGLAATPAWAIAGPIGIAGAGGLVAFALCGAGFRDVLAMRPMVWLGQRSYTLYLIHEPILVTFVLAFGLTKLTWWWIPFGIAVSIAAAAVTYLIIEQPVLRLIRRVPR